MHEAASFSFFWVILASFLYLPYTWCPSGRVYDSVHVWGRFPLFLFVNVLASFLYLPYTWVPASCMFFAYLPIEN